MVPPPPPSRRLAAARAGKFGDKQYTRLLFRVGSFALLLVGTLALSVYAQGGDFADDEHATGLRGLAQRMSENRRLAACGDGADQCRCPPTAGAVVLMVLGVLYIFLAIAIVCDELFVPALEIISERFDLSDDVSGATLMAAGGSAPELATSLIGTFKDSSVGFGTIVGSAVFNVLFVIGMCALYTPPEKAPLRLTWWPLARDCSYYIITLVLLAYWFSDEVIQLHEAVIQFLLYFGYVGIMSQSEKLEAWLKGHLCKAKSMDSPRAVTGAGGEKGAEYSVERRESKADVTGMDERTSAVKLRSESSAHFDPNALFLKPSTFRAGILHMLTSGKDVGDTIGVGVVAGIKGDVNETFNTLDRDKSGYLDCTELKELLGLLDSHDSLKMTDERVAALLKVLDTDNNGKIDRNEFTKWYISSEERLKLRTREVFDKFDLDGNGCVADEELANLMQSLTGDLVGDKKANLDKAVQEFKDDVNRTPGQCTFDDFSDWYEETIFWTKTKSDASDLDDVSLGLWQVSLNTLKELPSMPPKELAINLLLLPINLTLGITVPDCRVPGKEGHCFATFITSILWIGGFSWFLVDWLDAIGLFCGIPIFIMGLTFLAAGTSVPDLLSSVVVAKQGKGDMAVSSSIGSNIFDVAVGLPLPWVLYILIKGTDVEVGADGVSEAIVILLLMVGAVVGSIAASGWKMSKTLGGGMFGLYFLFVAYQIARNWPLVAC